MYTVRATSTHNRTDHDVYKTIEVSGPARDIAIIYRHLSNASDIFMPKLRYDQEHQLGWLVKHLRGNAKEVVDNRGWSKVVDLEFGNGGNTLIISVSTPWGHLVGFMEWLRKTFPNSDFTCTKDSTGEINEFN